uniref:Uncharacterized protein n=1 Tax=Romanomermis culicivorax TaxID=13658 RepID=A0A915HIA1_ROMCU
MKEKKEHSMHIHKENCAGVATNRDGRHCGRHCIIRPRDHPVAGKLRWAFHIQIDELDDQRCKHLHRDGAPQRDKNDNQINHLKPRQPWAATQFALDPNNGPVEAFQEKEATRVKALSYFGELSRLTA